MTVFLKCFVFVSIISQRRVAPPYPAVLCSVGLLESQLRGPSLQRIIRRYPRRRLWYLDSRLLQRATIIWMMCLLLITMHRLFNYLTTLASKTQHQLQLAGQHGVHRYVVLASRAQSSVIAAVIPAIAISTTVALLIMTIWFNHFRQRLVIFTQSHFGINKPGPVLSDCTPLSRAEEFYLSHNGVTGKSKTF